MMKIFTLSVFLLFSGCAYGPYGPRTLQDIFHQTNEKEVTSAQTMDFPLPSMSFSKASQGPEGGVKKEVKKNNEKKLSLKQIYFLTLFYQYKSLSSLIYPQVSYGKNLQQCPRFHNLFLEHKSKPIGLGVSFSTLPRFKQEEQLMAKNNPEFFPELYLPKLAKKNQENGDGKESFEMALGQHVDNIKGQLEEICNTGYSYEYYIFENLSVNAKKHPKFGANPESFKKIIKNIVLFNHYLELSLTDGKLPSMNAYDEVFEEYLQKGHIAWIKEFYDYFAQKRKTDI